SRGRLPEHLVDAGLEPLVPVGLSRLREPLAHDEDVVVRRRPALELHAHDLTQLALDAVADDCVADRLRHGEAEPRRPDGLVALKPVERQEPGRDRPAVAVDRIEVAGAGKTISALHRLTPRGACGPSTGGA